MKKSEHIPVYNWVNRYPYLWCCVCDQGFANMGSWNEEHPGYGGLI